MDKLFLIDGHALCYRSFFAIRELTASTGQATNAVFGFVNTLRKIMREFNPQYLAVCFDSKEKTHRAKKYTDYKIQRPRMPELLIDQIPIIKEVISAYHLPIFEMGGYEADDIIATLTELATQNKLEVTIVTEDKDMFQLSNKHTHFFSPRKDQILKENDVRVKLGFDPIHITDFIALAGDSSDNIPGVDGLGPVTATKLILDYGDIDGIYKNIENISKEKVKEKLVNQREIAFLSKELAMLDKNVPLKFDLDKLRVGEPNKNRLYELFKQLEFNRFAQEYAGQEGQKEYNVDVHVLSNDEDIKSAIKNIRKVKRFAFLSDDQADALFSQVYLATEGYVYSVNSDQLNKLSELFEDESIIKVTHNCKEMFKRLSFVNIESLGETFDVLLAGYLLSANISTYSPTELGWTYFNITLGEEQLKAKETAMVYQLYDVFKSKLKEFGLDDLYRKIERPLAYVLYKMETYGVSLDLPHLKDLSELCQRKMDELTKKLYKIAGEEFNINSPKQLGVILFEKLSLPTIKKTKTGNSTDEEVLTKLSELHEFPGLILEYRQLSKLKSTYIDALPKLVCPHTGKIHAEFNQVGAETGRLSSRNPNLQNIPIRSELGKQVRKAIIPSEGRILLAADYSQIELRILAHLSGDESLAEAFNNDHDIHNYTASLIFDVDQSEIDYSRRDTAKRVNFGIVYGMSGFGLSKDLGISQKEANDFITRYFNRYPKVKIFMDQQIEYCQKNGYVLTLLNRRRYIPDINSKNNAVRQFAERQAINTPVQGSAADLMKLAMINVHQEIEKQKLKSAMSITVHDELVFDLVPKEQEKMFKLVKDTMEQTIKLNVPVKVDLKIGKNWMEMEKVKI
ncbi:MAG: DNA polymerase I [Candidatus Omnitrophica bacterium]|nr:DNA polymerase I [Candidatus Omnitrophota bacterium]